MRNWSDSINPATIPDSVLASERARRLAARRKSYGAGTGRPRVMRACDVCGEVLSATEMRKHKCTGEQEQ